MWKCPNCGSTNETSFCKICNNAKPISTQQHNTTNTTKHRTNVGQQDSNYSSKVVPANVNANPDTHYYAPKSSVSIPKSNRPLIILCIVLSTLAIGISSAAVAIYFNNSKTQEPDIDHPYDTKTNLNAKSLTDSNIKIASEISDIQRFIEENLKNDSEGTEQSKADKNNSNKPESPTKTTNDSSADNDFSYEIYENEEYGFYCAYPNNFVPSTPPNNINWVKCWKSPDDTAIMTLRACADKNGISIDQAVKDFKYEYSGEVTYYANGETWYAISCLSGDRIIYRKFFTKNGNMYCLDFEYDKKDKNIYYDCIEYIEDNFKAR